MQWLKIEMSYYCIKPTVDNDHADIYLLRGKIILFGNDDIAIALICYQILYYKDNYDFIISPMVVVNLIHVSPTTK